MLQKDFFIFFADDKPQLSFSNDITVCFWPSAVLGSGLDSVVTLPP